VDPKIWEIIREDPRFAYEAYEFVCEAVTFTQDRLGRAPVGEAEPGNDGDRHVSGAELLRGACDLAVRDFGMMAPVVFRVWGVRSTDDLGDIVFNLIRAEKLSKSDRDEPDDFRGLFDLPAALSEGFELTTADYAPRKAADR
jgi:uncharacterized repeat protein (TIGR04138 family)